MKRILMLGVFASFCLFPLSANAECSSERLVELSKIADNVTLSYTYELGIADADFQIVISNLTNDIYIEDDSGIRYSGVGDKKAELTYMSGESKIFTVYSNDNNCKGESLTSKYITLPTYNEYSTYEECEGIEDYKLCKQWIDLGNMEEDEFLKEVKAYKDSLKQTKQKNPENKNDGFLSFIKQHYLYFLIPIIVIVIGIGVWFVLIKKKKDKLL